MSRIVACWCNDRNKKFVAVVAFSFCISVKDYNWRIPITAPWKRPVLCWWWRTLPREFWWKALWQFLHVRALSNLAFSISVSGNMSFCMIIFSHIVFFRRKCDRKTSRQRRLLSKGKVRKFRHRLWILLDSKVYVHHVRHGKCFLNFFHLSLSSAILIDFSTRSTVHVLILSIQAVRGLPRLHASGIVPCIVSFFRQLPCFYGLTILF